jgi:hypothetical protein
MVCRVVSRPCNAGVICFGQAMDLYKKSEDEAQAVLIFSVFFGDELYQAAIYVIALSLCVCIGCVSLCPADFGRISQR